MEKLSLIQKSSTFIVVVVVIIVSLSQSFVIDWNKLNDVTLQERYTINIRNKFDALRVEDYQSSMTDLSKQIIVSCRVVVAKLRF